MLQLVVDHDIEVKMNIFEGLDKVVDAVALLGSGKSQGKNVIIVDKELAKRTRNT